MKMKEQKSGRELPPIPDYPDAPLPAWKHYGITNYADQRIKEEFDRIKYEGYMVGLEVAYTLENENDYAMSFGKINIPEDVSQSKEADVDIPLSDDFLEDLLQMLTELIPANSPGYSGEMNPALTIVMTGSLIKATFKCRIPEQCSRGHTDKRWCKKVNDGLWTCMKSHKPCR